MEWSFENWIKEINASIPKEKQSEEPKTLHWTTQSIKREYVVNQEKLFRMEYLSEFIPVKEVLTGTKNEKKGF